MLSFEDQLKKGLLRCPNTHSSLKWDKNNNLLKSDKDNFTYPVINGVPVLLKDEKKIIDTLNTSKMLDEYMAQSGKSKGLFNKLVSKLMYDFRTKKSIDAFKIFDTSKETDLCIAIGGGPLRHHKNLFNLNIGQFDNVDMVADAHFLPYNNSCIDAIFCEAVLEHIQDPSKVVSEMSRVLKPGAIVLSITPFLQAYHGYPHHYQNYTLTGHENLFKSHGFDIDESGTCVGPTYALIMLNFLYLKKFLPKFLGSVISKIFLIFAMICIKPLDKILNTRNDSNELANSTYVVARRSG